MFHSINNLFENNFQEYCEYLGEINISNIPKSYNDSLLRINNYCENNSELKNIPWLINTMGFSNGLGVKVSTINISNYSHAVVKT